MEEEVEKNISNNYTSCELAESAHILILNTDSYSSIINHLCLQNTFVNLYMFITHKKVW